MKKEKRSFYIVLIITCIVGFQFTIMTIQRLRYDRGVYDCSDMSEDCEAFFELLGIDTKLVNGKNRETGVWHQWILLDLGVTTIYFESTHLIPVPKTYYTERHSDIYVSEGFIKDGKTTKDQIFEYSELK